MKNQKFNNKNRDKNVPQDNENESDFFSHCLVLL